jgi:hypothetical protein
VCVDGNPAVHLLGTTYGAGQMLIGTNLVPHC